MADKWAVASGNWSSTSTWNDGTLPGSGDDVYADGFTVTVNQDVTVFSLRTTQRSGGVDGGSFTCSSSRTIVASLYGGLTDCLTVSGSAALTLTGNVFGSDTASSRRGILYNSTGNLVINGSVFAGSRTGANGISMTGNCSFTLNGNCSGGSGFGAVGVSNTSAASTIVVNGNATAGDGSTAYGISNVSTSSVTLNGIAIASNNAEAVNNASTGTFTIARFRFASNGKSPWTGNGKIFFNPLSTVNGDVVNSSGTSRTLGRVGG